MAGKPTLTTSAGAPIADNQNSSTKELQAFWLNHLETKGAFGDASNMRRRQDGRSTED